MIPKDPNRMGEKQDLSKLKHRKYKFNNIANLSSPINSLQTELSFQKPKNQTLQTWTRILSDSKMQKQKNSIRRNLHPREYMNLFEKVSIRQIQPTKQHSKEHSKVEIFSINRVSKVQKRRQKQFDKHSVNQTCRQIIGIIQSARNTQITEQKLIKLIQSSLKNPSMQSIFINKGIYNESLSIVDSYQLLMSNMNKFYISNPDSYIFMYLKEFKNALQSKINSIDDRMIKSLQRCISRLKLDGLKSKSHIQILGTDVPKHLHVANLLGKIRDCQTKYGEFSLISSFNRNRFQAFQKVNFTFDLVQ